MERERKREGRTVREKRKKGEERRRERREEDGVQEAGGKGRENEG